MLDFVAFGETLIDFTPSGTNSLGYPLYAENPGGAPLNVLAMSAKLGARTAFIGKVGKDSFGSFLKKTVESAGIDTSFFLEDERYNTTLSFVSLNARGDRSFSFYREKGADLMVEKGDVELPSSLLFHFGSVSMTSEPAASTTESLVREAKEKGSIISYDPNYRALLWKSEKEAVSVMRRMLSYADLLKVSYEEMVLLTGAEDIETASAMLSETGAALVVVTLGPEGAFIRKGDYTEAFRTYDVKTIDTTGAGDAFWGAFLYTLFLDYGLRKKEEIAGLSKERLEYLMKFSNAAGSMATTKSGAIPALPEKNEIIECMKSIPLL